MELSKKFSLVSVSKRLESQGKSTPIPRRQFLKGTGGALFTSLVMPQSKAAQQAMQLVQKVAPSLGGLAPLAKLMGSLRGGFGFDNSSWKNPKVFFGFVPANHPFLSSGDPDDANDSSLWTTRFVKPNVTNTPLFYISFSGEKNRYDPRKDNGVGGVAWYTADRSGKLRLVSEVGDDGLGNLLSGLDGMQLDQVPSAFDSITRKFIDAVFPTFEGKWVNKSKTTSELINRANEAVKGSTGQVYDFSGGTTRLVDVSGQERSPAAQRSMQEEWDRQKVRNELESNKINERRQEERRKKEEMKKKTREKQERVYRQHPSYSETHGPVFWESGDPEEYWASKKSSRIYFGPRV
jgi:hypothetical protein